MARSKDRVVVGFVHPVDVAAGFMQSLLMLTAHDMTSSQRIADIQMENASANISNARNKIARDFLQRGKAEWLWMVDADMTFGPDTLDRLLDSAHDASHPIVGGLCFGIHDHRLFPTLYGFETDDDGRPYTVRFNTYPDHGKLQVHATGAACLLIHRKVLQAIADATEAGAKFTNRAYPWFQETEMGGQPVGEDVTFCLRAGVLGFPVHVDCDIRIGHQKTVILTHDMYVDQLRLDAMKGSE